MFQSAALVDAVKRANIVAPTRGSELDRYKGFVFELNPETTTVLLRVTNGEVYYSEVLYPFEVEGEEGQLWRVSSVLAHNIISNLPLASDGKVKFVEEQGKLRITHGKMRASTPLIDADSYPTWEIDRPENFRTMTRMGQLLDTVAWAAENNNVPPRCGVYMSTEAVSCTQHGVISYMPVEFEFLDNRRNVVIPINQVGAIVRSMEEVQVSVVGGNMYLSPNEDVLIRCSLYDDSFPDVEGVVGSTNPEGVVFLNRTEVQGILSRVNAVNASDRQRALAITIGDEQVNFSSRDKSSGDEIEESMFAQGADHDPVLFHVSVEFFTSAIDNCPTQSMLLQYNPSNPKRPIKICGEQPGYNVVLMPRIIPKGVDDGTA